jgi:hypothetical protein
MSNYRVLMSYWLSVTVGLAGCGDHILIGGDPGADSASPTTTTSGSGGTGGSAGDAGSSGSAGDGGSGGAGGSAGASSGSGGGDSGNAGGGGSAGAPSDGGSGGRRDVGYNPLPDGSFGGTGGWAGASGSGGAGGSIDASDSGGGRVPDPKDGGACYAACGTPAGTVATFSSAQALYAVLVGRWFFCSGEDGRKVYGGAPADVVGVEYGPPAEKFGDMYYLVWGPNGLERGAGFDYQLTYHISESVGGDGTVSLQLNNHPLPNSGFWTRFRYSSCPVQFQMKPAYSEDQVILLPVD